MGKQSFTLHICAMDRTVIYILTAFSLRPNSYHAFLGTCGASIICNLAWLWNPSLIVHIYYSVSFSSTMVEWQAQFALLCGGPVGFRLFVPTWLAVVMCYRCLLYERLPLHYVPHCILSWSDGLPATWELWRWRFLTMRSLACTLLVVELLSLDLLSLGFVRPALS